jgi:hypothetical protein
LVLIFLLFVGLDILRRGRQNPPSKNDDEFQGKMSEHSILPYQIK